ncbi:MAG: glycerophosphodiester phosphodiesterase [Ruminococcaceae bacterium]|nr:glycerophosphodiester phosphodiesterase [Oscillospiraceae bacterium]
MKPAIAFVSVAAVFAGVTAAGICLKKFIKPKKTNYNLPVNFTVTAHTGCEGRKDNSLESISAGAAAGADIVEIDLHFMPDGTAVLSHDKPNNDSSGKIYPTLEDAFRVLSELDVKMNIDVKSTDNISSVFPIAEKYGVADKIFFTGVNEDFVSAVKEGAPEISYYLNVSVDKSKKTDKNYISSIVEKVKDCGAVGINLNFKGCSEELVDSFRKENLQVSVWTANKKSEMLRCLSLSPDNITTRYPSVILSLISD